MCNIAGYVGFKQAAPILIDMLRRQEKLDGGLSTGIATIHNGVVYHAKVLGGVDELVKNTQAMQFPGTVGIIHSRPDNNYIEFAHPFVSQSKKTAVVCNGNMCSDKNLAAVRNSIASFLNIRAGIKFESALKLPSSSYPQLKDGRYAAYGDVFAETVENCVNVGNMSYEEAMADASGKLFADVVNVLINTDNPDKIYVARISRPMNILTLPEESFISTSQFGFLNIPGKDNIKSLPTLKSCVITKNGFTVSDSQITGGDVIDYTPEEYREIKSGIIKKLKAEPTSMDTMGGGILVTDLSPYKLRPNAKVVYDILWELYNEGILKSKDDEFILPWTLDVKAPRTFFYI